MNNVPLNLPEYVPHEGTVKIGSDTHARKAAYCALQKLDEKKPNPIEFLFIGAGAGHQAFKAVAVLTDLFDEKHKGAYTLMFRTMRFKTKRPESTTEIDAQVWRAYVIDLTQLQRPSE